jgi:heme-degrading monooxygenase HmoA
MRQFVYEVQVTVNESVLADYLSWYPGHVKHVAACPGFLSARILESTERANVLKSVFVLESKEAFDAYVKNQAPALRADTERRFGGQFKAERSTYYVVL